jgi:hypothetical protein
MQVLKFASIYKEAAFSSGANANLHRWAAGIVNQAFRQVMGRAPTPAERQIVMAVSDLESNYGKGWKEGQGAGSNNWGAVQTKSKENSFSHQDSSVQGKYVTNFKEYPDDIAGAADVVRNLFRANLKQRMPDPNNGNRAMGANINGPGRAELIQAAAQEGDTNAFSRAMWYTDYFEGIAPDFTDRIMAHANTIQKNVNSIASALGEPAAWSQQSPGNFLPVTNDRSVLNQIGSSSKNVNMPIARTPQQSIEDVLPPKPQQETSLENLLWFQ